ncbi:MAG TPA: glutaminase, partial [Candidatus Ligilactobacillus excrementigallinarum]|nr:glutaminase [Candidatus Ligilactobacillus excrementigallinarum]
SGVGGGLMAAVPEKCGIGIYGPALDKFGNSVAGMKVLNKIVDKYDLNIFD